MHTITCIVCGTVVKVQRYELGKRKYCANACRLKALHESNRKPDKSMATCQNCGKSFKTFPSNKSHYCGRSCYDIAQRNHPGNVFDHVEMGGDDECWNFTGKVTRWGYGRFIVNRIHKNAHRWAFIAANGYDPVGLVVMHSCDNRLCCNPAHLSADTQKANIQDMIAKGRRATIRRGPAKTPKRPRR